MTGKDATSQLLKAVLEGDLSAARAAIEAGANVNATDAIHGTPLHWAVALAQVELVRLLIEKGADILAKNFGGETPLDLAQQGSHQEVAAILTGGGQPPKSHAARIAKQRRGPGSPNLSR